MNNPTVFNLLVFAVLPYIALFSFFLGTIMRFRKAPFSYSSLSSQFLETRQHFWGLVSFHYGIIFVLLGHLVGLLIPRQILLWNSRPLRLYVLEITSLAFGLMTLVGLVSILHRRTMLSKPRRVTSAIDWIIESMVLLQVAAGIYVAIFHPWGTSWFAASASPYLWSIFKFSPDITYLTTLPFAVKLHIINAWAIIALFPFTRLVHMLVVPFPYLWRKPEVVRWYGIRMLPEQERARAASAR
ncbi:MAG: respiratory nitrate reductase subunit gamma [Terriglobales bacterium]